MYGDFCRLDHSKVWGRTWATAARSTGLADEIKGAGVATRPSDAPKFARAIEQLLNDKELRAEMGKRRA